MAARRMQTAPEVYFQCFCTQLSASYGILFADNLLPSNAELQAASCNAELLVVFFACKSGQAIRQKKRNAASILQAI
jgi:hypothetical protein